MPAPAKPTAPRTRTKPAAPKPAPRKPPRPAPPPFEVVEHVVWGLTWKWAQSKGVDFDDYFSVGMGVYLDLAASWEGVFPFRHCLKYQVWTKFHDKYKAEARKSKLYPQEGLDQDLIPTQIRSDFDVDEFVEKLPADAGRAVKLVIESPKKLVALVREIRSRSEPERFRAAVRAYMTTALKWDRRRQEKCFSDVREALSAY